VKIVEEPENKKCKSRLNSGEINGGGERRGREILRQPYIEPNVRTIYK
jgi:hypothetical protein